MAKRIASGAWPSTNSWLISRPSASRVALHDSHRLREVLAGAAARPEEVELLLGQAADADRRLLGRHAHLDGAAGRGHHVDHRPHRGRHAGGVDARREGRPAPPHPRPFATTSAAVVHRRVSAPSARASSSRLSCRSTSSTSAPSSRATTATHWPIGPAPSTTTRSPGLDAPAVHGVDRDRDRLGQRRQGAVGGGESGTPAPGGGTAAPEGPRRCGCPPARSCRRRSGRPTLHG